eukprot:c13163_g4_i1.p1 GENE.c13163_g4_i1~~c13163_g4_i1.p1  ORF type:complete len:602 (-),score=117.76 c13163_g4_i1:473-2224(-)
MATTATGQAKQNRVHCVVSCHDCLLTLLFVLIREIMAVWYRLYLGEKHKKVVRLKCNINSNIADFLDLVKNDYWKESLLGVIAPELDVYQQGTTLENRDDRQPLKLSIRVPSDTDDDNPLVVFSPGPAQPAIQEPQDALLQRVQAMTLTDITTELKKYQKVLPESDPKAMRAHVTRPLDFVFCHPKLGDIIFSNVLQNQPRIRVPEELFPHLLEIKKLKFPDSGSSEDSWHHIHDFFFRDVLVEIIELFVTPVFHDRNRTDPRTSKSNFRPDVIIKADGFVVLRGEEKSDNCPIDDADREIVEKMRDWSAFLYGRMPYIFAYTTRAEHVRLHFITQSRQPQVIRDYNLKSSTSRFELVEAVIQIGLMVPQLIERVPKILREAHIYSEQTISRQEGQCSLKFSNSNVLKTWTQLSTCATRTAYAQLATLSSRQNRPRGLICAKVENKEGYTLAVRMMPLGFTLASWERLTDDQMLIAIRDVVAGLNTWHWLGFCHGDVRPLNIVCLNVELSEWALIDFDYSHKVTDKATIDWNHPCCGEVLSFVSDWKQVAALIGPHHQKLQNLKEMLGKHTKPEFDVARVKFD